MEQLCSDRDRSKVGSTAVSLTANRLASAIRFEVSYFEVCAVSRGESRSAYPSILGMFLSTRLFSLWVYNAVFDASSCTPPPVVGHLYSTQT